MNVDRTDGDGHGSDTSNEDKYVHALERSRESPKLKLCDSNVDPDREGHGPVY